jgi:Tol biopolymer transport system component
MLCLWSSAACTILAAPTATPPPTFTPTPIPPTATTPPSLTPSATASPTDLPTATHTPQPTFTPLPTETPTLLPTPSNTPAATPALTYDNWGGVTVPAGIIDRLGSPLIAFINANDRQATTDLRTPRPGNTVETLYYVSPSSPGNRLEVLEVDVTTGDDIYIARDGTALAYMRLTGNFNEIGLYVVDLRMGLNARVIALPSLVQRGIVTAPVWSPDSTRFAIPLETGYDLDIFGVGRDGLWSILVSSGAYEWAPAWSPDGRYLAFLSDRDTCPSWRPGEAGTCDAPGALPPLTGSLYIMDVQTRAITRISTIPIAEPPQWVNTRQIAFASGDPVFDGTRSLYIADVITLETRAVTLTTGDDAIKLGGVWSSDGRNVVYQAAGVTTEVVLADVNGTPRGRLFDLPFTRYGMIAAWSPDGTRVAIGGTGGQCPYGVIVYDNAFTQLARGNPPPSMCEPSYSPDGRWLAFTGVNPRIDGRVDVYIANQNGFSAQNLTASLRGSMELLGWVGG